MIQVLLVFFTLLRQVRDGLFHSRIIFNSEKTESKKTKQKISEVCHLPVLWL